MSETPQERAEAARVRRRWLNLGEILAIGAVAISGLTFWNSYAERKNNEAEHAAESAQSAKKAVVLTLRSSADKDGRTLSLTPRADNQAIQNQTILFPTALGLSPAETSGEGRIERGWFDSALVKARRAAGVEDKLGDAKLPVVIETHYLADGDPQVDRAVFELGYATSHSFIGGTEVHLRGLARERPAASAEAGQKQIDAIWKARMPAKE
ncbi:hypothetical protein [Sphingomonas sp. MMS24-J13]|uniref:hypothetical protein n=1 Tax=Sphingomonas sp. MMS24-J13 TaxID=3238686 RepID=UPI0038504841